MPMTHAEVEVDTGVCTALSADDPINVTITRSIFSHVDRWATDGERHGGRFARSAAASIYGFMSLIQYRA
jgi:hypothetical protein